LLFTDSMTGFVSLTVPSFVCRDAATAIVSPESGRYRLPMPLK
jgi:hypothetical protein